MRPGSTVSRMVMALLLALGLSLPRVALAESMMPDDMEVAVYEDGTGYLPSNEPVLSIHADGATTAELPPLRQTPLPASYSSYDQGYVTSAKGQGNFNTCWAFSSLGAIEASTLQRDLIAGETADTLDLSERHLAFFAYNTQTDPLGGTTGDSTAPYNSTYLARGGNDLIATYTLASWMGVAREDALGTYEDLMASYDPRNPSQTNLDPSLSHGIDVLHLTRSMRIPMRDVEDVKRAVMSYGGVSVGMYMSTSNLNTSTSAYLCKTYTAANHAVLIVGWDDNYPVSNFKSGAQPSAPGAWLVKNSWGATWGDGGTFWISYEDVVVDRQNATAYVAEPAELRDNIYQHDGSASMFYNHVRTGGSVAGVFTACGNTGGTEELTAVGIAITSTNVMYSIQVYTDIEWQDDPTSGNPQLEEPQTGTIDYAGYRVIDLDQPVPLEEGQTFSVVVTLALANPGAGLGDDGDLVGYDVDRTNLSSSYYRFTNAIEPGQSFERDCEGSAWDDLGNDAVSDPDEEFDGDDEVACSARVKAFTVNVGGSGEPDPDLEPTNPPKPKPTPATWERVAGTTRYDTMATMAVAGFEAGSCTSVVLATGDNYPDALVASSLAGANGCPVILTSSSTLSQQAHEQIERLGVKHVYIMGGSFAISPDVEEQVKQLNGGIETKRISGDDRQGTSLAVMNLVSQSAEWDGTVIIATGRSFADALSIGPYSYASQTPILLAGADGLLTAEQVKACEMRGVSRAVVVGGELAVRDEVARQLGLSWGTTCVRLGGDTRYDTSIAIAEWELEQGLGLEHVAVATGQNFPDALSGAALCGRNISVLLLVCPPSNVSTAASVITPSRKTQVKTGYVLGGEAVVTPSMKEQLEALLQ